MRLRWLDVLRGVAVLLVLGRHMPGAQPSVATPVREVFLAWANAGWIGVDLFFVLSGFLVSGLLFGEFRARGEIDAGRFLLRRALKLYPAFWVMIGVTAAWHVARGQLVGVELGERLVWELLYVQNYNPALWSHTWSLAIEEHFYLLLCVLLGFLSRRSQPERDPFRALLWIVPLVATLTLAGRIATVAIAPDRPLVGVLYPTHLRVDSLLWGVLLSYLYHLRRDRLLSAVRGRQASVLVVAGVLIAPAFIWPVERTPALVTVGLTGLGLGFMLVLALLAARQAERRDATDRPAVLPVRALAAIGVHSYSIYLWHMLVRWWIMPPLWTSGALAFGGPTLRYLILFATYFAICIALGVVMGRAVEQPVLMLRDRWWPSRASAASGHDSRAEAPVDRSWGNRTAGASATAP